MNLEYNKIKTKSKNKYIIFHICNSLMLLTITITVLLVYIQLKPVIKNADNSIRLFHTNLNNLNKYVPLVKNIIFDINTFLNSSLSLIN